MNRHDRRVTTMGAAMPSETIRRPWLAATHCGYANTRPSVISSSIRERTHAPKMHYGTRKRKSFPFLSQGPSPLSPNTSDLTGVLRGCYVACVGGYNVS